MASPTPAPPPLHDAPKSARSPLARRRTWLVLAGISLGWKLLVFTLGAALPRWILTDGIAELPPEHQQYAMEAGLLARQLWSGPLERHGLVQLVRVESVDTVTPPTDDCRGLGARVRAYTYFAIPYSEVRTRCGRGTVEYRVFRRRAGHAR